MATLNDPLLAAAAIFFLGAAATMLLRPAAKDANEMEAATVFRLMLGPACLAVMILILSKAADHFYLIR